MRSSCRKLLLKQISWLRLHEQYCMAGELNYGNVHENWTFTPTFNEKGLINDLFAFLLSNVANIFRKPPMLITLSTDVMININH